MRPTELPAPRGIPAVGTPAIGHQPSPEILPQELLGYGGTARSPHNKDGDPGRHGRPQPGALPAFTPPGFVHISYGLRVHVGARFGHGCGHGLHRLLLQVYNGPDAYREAEQVVHGALRGALRQMIGAGAQRGNRLHAWAKLSHGNATRQFRPRGRATGGTDQSVQLIFGHDRLDGRNVRHLMSLGLRILPAQRVLAVQTLHRLEWNPDVHRFHRQQNPRLALMARLPARLAPTGFAAWPLAYGVGWIGRGRLRRVPRSAPQAPGQFFHRRSQLGHFCPQLGDRHCLRHNQLLRRWRCVFPYLWQQRWMSVHRALTLPPGAVWDKDFLPQPRERLLYN
jgi:hypothetical protein